MIVKWRLSSSSRRHRGWEIPGCDWSTQLCFLLIGRGLVTKLIVADKEPPTTQQQLWRVERGGGRDGAENDGWKQNKLSRKLRTIFKGQFVCTNNNSFVVECWAELQHKEFTLVTF